MQIVLSLRKEELRIGRSEGTIHFDGVPIHERNFKAISHAIDRQALVDEAVDRAIEIIRNRIDQFGLTEPTIQKQGNRRTIIERVVALRLPSPRSTIYRRSWKMAASSVSVRMLV